ncbi:MAG: methylenetetrahydrofolate reductase [NAD(P)H] [Phycisphaerales bacterium]|nr:methylenetetrahydrofolate reductase [NAD(P)H] [Phycisphaerales bacterium]
MHIRDILDRDATSISFEFFPPHSDEAVAALESRLDDFATLAPSFVSVTYGAGGSTRDRTNDLVLRLKAGGRLDPVPHLTCIRQSAEEVQSILARYAEHGVNNVLALRGDPPSDGSDWSADEEAFPHAVDLVRAIVEFNASGRHQDTRGFGIGVAGFPEGHPETPNQLRHMDHLKEKVDVGVDWITTQMFFDNDRFWDWCARCELAGVTVPKIAGIMPVTSLSTLRRMADLAAGTTFPATLLRRIHRWQDDAAAVEQVGVQWAVEQCNALLDQGVDGLHLYTLNRSDATKRLVEALGASSAADVREH